MVWSGLALAPLGWMATLPVMGYVVGGALSTSLVVRTQARLRSAGVLSTGPAGGPAVVPAVRLGRMAEKFWLLCAATLVAGYYNANAGLYRFCGGRGRRTARKSRLPWSWWRFDWGHFGPYLAAHRTRTGFEVPFGWALPGFGCGGALGYAGFVAGAFAPLPTKNTDPGRPLSSNHASARVYRRCGNGAPSLLAL